MAKATRTDVLNLEWTSTPHRDRESATLICNYLRLNGLSVVEKSIHDGFRHLVDLAPRALLMTNTIGSDLNVQVAAFAKARGIPVIATISEGLFNDAWIEQMFWGANPHRLTEDLRLLWSETSRRSALAIAPQYEERLRVAGSVGADRFVFCDDGAPWLDNPSPRRTVVGVGCFDFGFVRPSHPAYELVRSVMGTDAIDRYAQDRDLVNVALIDVVRQNPNTVFLLKEHPGAGADHWRGAIEGAAAFDNAVVVHDDHSLVQCMAASDIWVSYESMTALEAWLMGRQTAVINPTGTDLPNRHVIWKGQPNYPTAAVFTAALDAFASDSRLPGFRELEQERKSVIEHVVQWADGLNHVRVGNEVIDFLAAGDRARTFPSTTPAPSRREVLRQKESWLKVQAHGTLARFLPGLARDRRYWDDEEIRAHAELRMSQQRRHYENSGLDVTSLRSIKAI